MSDARELIGVFGYGSLVAPASIAATLGHEVSAPHPARLSGWRRRWSLVRDNHRSEKGFEPTDTAAEPFDWCLGLNLEHDPGAPADTWPNGAVINIAGADLERLDVRELRYDRVELDPDALEIRGDDPPGPDALVTYLAKPANHRREPPARSVILASYLRTVEAAFEALGPGELERFRTTTGPPPAPVVEARLVRDAIPPGNPRSW